MTAFQGIPYAGPLQLSLDDCKDDLIDLPPNAMMHMRKVKPGIEAVVIELQNTLPNHGEAAGIVAGVHQRFTDETTLINKLRGHEIALEKALEVVRETRAKKEHERENTVAQIVDTVRSTALRTGDSSVLASFEKTIEYNTQTAMKAAQTRRKNGRAPQNPQSP
jgi:hypothetical protein